MGRAWLPATKYKQEAIPAFSFKSIQATVPAMTSVMSSRSWLAGGQATMPADDQAS